MGDIIEIAEIEKRLALIEEKDKVAKAQRKKYSTMTYAQVLQEPENIERLKETEREQKNTFISLIKKREELKHLKGQEDELFAEYFMNFLKNKVISINDFFYEDRLTPIDKRILKKEYQNGK